MRWACASVLPGAKILLRWFRRRNEADRLVKADVGALVRNYGHEAYWEARRRERDVVLPDRTTHQGKTPAHWRRVALIVANRTGHTIGLDTATRMLSPIGQATPLQSGKYDSEEVKRLTGL
jgi:hypothetical protein